MLDRENIYLIGIGGIGMSALARYFNGEGKKVAGYDRATTDLTKRLQGEGIAVTDFQDADAIPFPFRDKESTLVIYTPAIPIGNPILTYFKEEGFTCLKRAAVLGKLSEGLTTVAVAGTHGKTTISTMLAHLLKSAGKPLNAFLGGISRDYGTNLLVDKAAELLVTEADEYDRSFLNLKPNMAVVSSLDADHLDVYGDQDEMVANYNAFVQQINQGGKLLTKPPLLEKLKPAIGVNTITYSINQAENADYAATEITVREGKYHFQLRKQGAIVGEFNCGLPGIHNVENALAALAIALELDVEVEALKSAISSFNGVKRRFDVHLKSDKLVYIDDYAHHPNEVKALLQSVREMYPDKKITTVFQPHLFSRTRDLADEFAEVLATSDELILLEIYPAREDPIEGIDSLWLSRKINKADVAVCKKNQLINILDSKEVEVLLTVGAGDIDTLIEPLIAHYEE